MKVEWWYPNDKTLIERVRHLKGQGLAAHREYWHDVVGYNYRMTNIEAALGLAQLERADDFITRKRNLAERYIAALSHLPIEVHREAPDTFHSYWMFSILVDQSEQRDALRMHLADAGIETRPLFYPVHTMPMYARNYRKHRVAEDLAWRGINLPSWPGLQQQHVEQIAKEIDNFYSNAT